jgi:putative tricarboxylic transport membrane protein
MKPENMPKADFVTSIVLMAFGIWVVVHSIQMPRFENLEANPFSVPGIVPGLLGVVISVLSLVVFLRSLKHKGHRVGINATVMRNFIKDASMQRMAVTILVCSVYGLGMIGRINYYAATFLFVLAFLLLFQYRQSQKDRAQGKLIAVSVLQAVLTAGAVGAVFRYLFLVQLP